MKNVGILIFALLVAATVSLTTAQSFCNQHNTDCNDCFGANLLDDKPVDDVCVWCNDPTTVGNNCQTISSSNPSAGGHDLQANCRNLNFMLGCAISYLAVVIIVVVGIFLVVCCCCACCICLIVLCVRASRGKSHVTYTHMS